ncbi:hypothetical protein KM043_010024 [Ampulex compressa]|nr:hypothetical protein KM043_010024 [Ampulex compressa]
MEATKGAHFSSTKITVETVTPPLRDQKLFCVARQDLPEVELNSTSPSTSELGELAEDMENDELNADPDDEEDAVEDILYMRGASFTIHLDPPSENFTVNASKNNEEANFVEERTEPRATSQGPNLEQKLPSTMESIVSTEPACSLDCGSAGNCYIEQSRGDDGELMVGEEDDDEASMDLEGNGVTLRRKQGSFRQRCQCPLGRGGDRCQLGTALAVGKTVRSPGRAPKLRAAIDGTYVFDSSGCTPAFEN